MEYYFLSNFISKLFIAIHKTAKIHLLFLFYLAPHF